MDDLDTTIQEIMRADSPFAYSFVNYVRRLIQQFNLFPRIEPYDVIFVAYERARSYIDSGKEINNMVAFLKGICLNVIRERSRSFRKEMLSDQEYIFDISILNESYDVKDIGKDIERLKWALKELKKKKPNDYKLIYFQYFKSMSNIEIKNHLKLEISDVALRQRLSRAIKRLRIIFHGKLLNV